jgi:hypothetical protein
MPAEKIAAEKTAADADVSKKEKREKERKQKLKTGSKSMRNMSTTKPVLRTVVSLHSELLRKPRLQRRRQRRRP